MSSNENYLTVNENNLTEVLAVFDKLGPEEKQNIFDLMGVAGEEDILSLISEQSRLPHLESLFLCPEYRLHKILLLYVSPVLLVLGTFGNIFSFLILRHKTMTRLSAYLYLATLSVADSLVLYIGLFRLWISELTGMDIRNHSDWLCKPVVFFGYVSSDISVWLIIAVTIERYIVVCHPLKVNKVCNISRAKKVVLVLLIAFAAINAHFFWTVELNELELDGVTTRHCSSAEKHQFLVGVVWPWVDALLYSFLPFAVITVFNTMIIKRIFLLDSKRRRLQGVGKDLAHLGKRHSKSSKKLTVMLLTVSFALLLTTLPMSVSMIVAHFWNNSESKDIEQKARFQLLKTVAELMMYLNHSINFILYCATGQKFRKQIIRMFCTKQHHLAALDDHSRHIYCSRNCALSHSTGRKQSSETEV